MNIVLLGRMAVAGSVLLEQELRQMGVTARIDCLPEPPTEADLNREVIARCQVAIGGPITRPMAERAREMKLFHVFRGGCDGLGLEFLAPHVSIANTYHHEKSVADFVLMAILNLSRRTCERDQRLRRGNWEGSAIWSEDPQMDALEGKVLLIVGWGRIGREVAERARPFGMRIAAITNRTDELPTSLVDERHGYDTLKPKLKTSDFVVVCCRFNAATKDLFGPQEFAAMNPSGFLLNVARGGIVNEEALYRALSERRIAGAAIDVWYQYPTSPDKPCFPSRFPIHELPNVLLSPHCSSWTRHMLQARVRDVAENIRRLSKGEPLLRLVPRGHP